MDKSDNKNDVDYSTRYGTQEMPDSTGEIERQRAQSEASRSPYDGHDQYAKQFGNHPSNPQRPISPTGLAGRFILTVLLLAGFVFVFRAVLSATKPTGEIGMGGLFYLGIAFVITVVIVAVIGAIFSFLAGKK